MRRVGIDPATFRSSVGVGTVPSCDNGSVLKVLLGRSLLHDLLQTEGLN